MIVRSRARSPTSQSLIRCPATQAPSASRHNSRNFEEDSKRVLLKLISDAGTLLQPSASFCLSHHPSALFCLCLQRVRAAEQRDRWTDSVPANTGGGRS